MTKRDRTTTTMKASEARDQWSGVLSKVSQEATRILIERNGVPVAAVVSTIDLQRLAEFDAQREQDFSVLDEIGEAFKDVSDEELEREVNRALRAARKSKPQPA